MKSTLSTLVVIITIAFLTLAYYGLFAKVTIVEQEVGDFWLLYEKHVGDYKDVGPVIDRIYSKLLGEDGITPSRGFGLYYDDPKKVEKKNLRSIVGCILDKQDESKIDYLKTNYQIKNFPSSKSVIVIFPYKGLPSIFLGVLKVYPKLSEYLAHKKYSPVPVMEIYDRPNEKIVYVASVNLDARVFDDFLK
jgi:hypothetical protein